MLVESIEALAIRPGGIYVDATFGSGGHSRAILERLGAGRLIAFDKDPDTAVNIIEDSRFTLINHDFRFLRQFLKFYNALPADGILADLGVSSHQLDSRERGFSFRLGGELDLRMNPRQKITAQQILNEYPEDRLSWLFRHYGELPNASKIALAIVERRATSNIQYFEELVELLRPFAPVNQENKFFARVVQAIRIEVNQELESLKELLSQSVSVLRQGGRIVMITYHSLEDRLVKNFFKSGNFEGTVESDFFGNQKRVFRLIPPALREPSDEEIRKNPRARSAKMRVAEKI